MRLWWISLRFFCRVFGLLVWRVRVFNTHRVPRRGGVLLVCNHQSYFDPVLAAVALPREASFMARDTLFRNRAFRWLIESLNAFPVKRGSADVGAIKESLRRLKRGEVLIAFPEGTRTPDGRVHDMHPGIFLVAKKARVPIVPTLILGAFEAWPRKKSWPRFAPIIVAYDEPIPAEQVARLSDEECIARVRARLNALMQRYRRHSHVARRLDPLPQRQRRSAGP